MRVSSTQITIFLFICVLLYVTIDSSENICQVCDESNYKIDKWLFIIKVKNGTHWNATCNGVFVSPWHGLITKQCYGKILNV